MHNTKEESVKKYRPDIIFISVIIAASLMLLLFMFVMKEEGAVAIVEIDGVVQGEYPLAVDGVFSINGGTNVLVIEDGAAYLSYSSCPDHTCERTGRIRYVGETIICLPNRVSITVSGVSDNAVDLVS